MINPLLPWRAAIIGAAVLAILPQAFAAPTEQELLHDNPAGNYLAARHAGTERDSAAAAAYYLLEPKYTTYPSRRQGASSKNVKPLECHTMMAP